MPVLGGHARDAAAGVPPGRQSDEDYRPSLAVLPFRTLQEDKADSYFAEGMVDDIIRLLGGLKELLVIARSSTLGFANSPLGSSAHRPRARRALRSARQSPSGSQQAAHSGGALRG